MAKKKGEIDYAHDLAEEFKCWDNLKNYGGSDPSWADGVNMNLVRNHIIYYKQKIEENYSEQDYPAIYYQETPPKVDNITWRVQTRYGKMPRGRFLYLSKTKI